MIAMKREVAAKCMNHAGGQVFRGANVKLGNWRQVTVQIRRYCEQQGNTCEGVRTDRQDTHGRVYSHRLSYLLRSIQ